MTAHRLAGIPFPDAPQGFCRWCGEYIAYGRRMSRRWHDGREGEPDCVLAHAIGNDRLRAAWKPLFDRDGGDCQGCGIALVKPRGDKWVVAVDWRVSPNVDHIVPAVDGGALALENLQLLCPDCHRAKTAQEARARAEARRPPDPWKDAQQQLL